MPEIGRTISHYRMLDKVGQGGMGVVYRAEDTNLNRQVAIKVLPDLFSGDPERMARFERKAKLLASLNHTNVAAIHGLEEADGQRFIVMELAELVRGAQATRAYGIIVMLEPGTGLGPYEILSPLGTGGVGGGTCAEGSEAAFDLIAKEDCHGYSQRPAVRYHEHRFCNYYQPVVCGRQPDRRHGDPVGE